VNRGFGLVQVLIALVIVAAAGTMLYTYVRSTTRAVETMKDERPLPGAKFAADVATLGMIQSALQMYRGEHGDLPTDKAAVLAILPAPPRFQCAGNDFEYDSVNGNLSLRVGTQADCN